MGVDNANTENKKYESNKGVLSGLIILLSIISVIAYMNTRRNREHQELVNKAIEEVTISHVSNYENAVNYHGLDIYVTYELKESIYDKKTKSAEVYYTAKAYSPVISKYKDVEYNSDAADELYEVLKNSYSVHSQRLSSTYSRNGIQVSVFLEMERPLSEGMIIYDIDGCKYEYITSAKSLKMVSIANEFVLWKELENTSSTASSAGSSSSKPSSNSSSSSEYTGKYDATLKYGSGKVLVCISEDAMDRYFTALNKGYEGTIDELESTGQIGWTAKGTKCNIIDFGISRCQVKLLDGIYAGNTVWVITESVEKK